MIIVFLFRVVLVPITIWLLHLASLSNKCPVSIHTKVKNMTSMTNRASLVRGIVRGLARSFGRASLDRLLLRRLHYLFVRLCGGRLCNIKLGNNGRCGFASERQRGRSDRGRMALQLLLLDMVLSRTSRGLMRLDIKLPDHSLQSKVAQMSSCKTDVTHSNFHRTLVRLPLFASFSWRVRFACGTMPPARGPSTGLTRVFDGPAGARSDGGVVDILERRSARAETWSCVTPLDP